MAQTATSLSFGDFACSGETGTQCGALANVWHIYNYIYIWYVPFTPPGPQDAIVTSHKVFSVSVGIPEAKNGETKSMWWLESRGPSGKMASRLSQNRLQQKIPQIDNQLCFDSATDWCEKSKILIDLPPTQIGRHLLRVQGSYRKWWRFRCKWWLQFWSIDLLLP